MKNMLNECPVCGGKLFIRELECLECSSSVKSKFIIPSVKAESQPEVDDEISSFIKIFISAEGNIKQTEKMLNCSYPKVKNLLKKAKAALGVSDPEPEKETDNILELLEKGEINVEEALKRLK
ncbi:MAG: DUF2089 family protein [Candidatus Delongbacteria bacterium]|nr:DUF2089 family protein [Candidatus Delongbacteria bacterium]MBN2835867.1 DUF2089 family protein [Candidatus Delongbacteria bacterium]